MTLKTELMSQLLDLFHVEAEELTASLSRGLIDLENAAGTERSRGVVETVYREAHTLKGAARTVQIIRVEELCQALEDVLAEVSKGRLGLCPADFSLLHKVVDLSRALALEDGSGDESQVPELIRELDRLAKGRPATRDEALARAPCRGGGTSSATDRAEAGGAAPATTGSTTGAGRIAGANAGGATPADCTIRVSERNLDLVLRQIEGTVSAKLAAANHVGVVDGLRRELLAGEKRAGLAACEARIVERCLESDPASGAPAPVRGALRRLIEHVGRAESDWKSLIRNFKSLERGLIAFRQELGRQIDSLVVDGQRLVMQPVSTVVRSFPKTVRDLAVAQEKRARVEITGDEIEVDKRILERIKSPLIHLLRNCVDHGLETESERRAASKPVEGCIRIEVARVANNRVRVRVSDDGAGIDIAGLRRAVAESPNARAGAAALDDADLLASVFESGVSTKELVTMVSGRGLGLAIVKDEIEGLGGTVEVTSRPGQGTTMTMTVPATRATFRGTMIAVGDRRFVVPTVSIGKVLRVDAAAIRAIEGREHVSYAGRMVPVYRLGELLKGGESLPNPDTGAGYLVILAVAADRIGVLVDSVICETEIVVKTLGPLLESVPSVSGGTLLQTGEVVPVLDVQDLCRVARESWRSPSPGGTAPAKPAARRRHSILLAEDSMTTRMLLKDILETADYEVETARDGNEAWESLRKGHFDLVVSDIQMPRMDGFELTRKIREAEGLKGLPVILVTTLESDEDKAKGVSAGANAYIVKRGFDHTTLLSAIADYL